jgi:RND family efflux transporter MFP subunit
MKSSLRFLLACLFCLPALAAAEQWLVAEPQDRPITVSASGIVMSSDALRFGTPPSRNWRATITQLAKEGSRVSAGDVLAQFDASATDDRVRTLSSSLNAKTSELESLQKTQESEIEDGKVRLAAARSAAEKAARKADTDADLFASLEYSKLVEEKVLTQQIYEQEQQRIELVSRVRQSKEDELQADIKRLQAELDGAQRELASFTIKAPRDGLVILGTNREGQKLDVNEAVNPGMTVVELADETQLVVQAEVPEFAATRIAVGQAANVSIDAAGGIEWQGEVTSVARIVRRQSQYSQAMVRDVSISLPEQAIPELRPGMSAKVSIEVAVQPGALAVPDLAIEYRQGQPGVFVRGGKWREVRLGQSSGGLRIIESGVSPGDEIRLR